MFPIIHTYKKKSVCVYVELHAPVQQKRLIEIG